MNRLLCIVFLALAVASCRKSTLIHTYYPLPQKSWSIRDTLTFHMPPITQDGYYEILAGLRLERHFPYDQVWLVIQQDFNSPMHQRRDTLCIQVADSAGNMQGFGLNMQQYETPLASIYLHKGQEGKLRLYHIMRKEILPQVCNAGIHIRQEGRN